MPGPTNPPNDGFLELRVPMAVAGYVRDAVHEARKNYEEDSLAEEPDEATRRYTRPTTPTRSSDRG